jgi:glycosyltransferase involved in cell wall biosynthesis
MKKSELICEGNKEEWILGGRLRWDLTKEKFDRDAESLELIVDGELSEQIKVANTNSGDLAGSKGHIEFQINPKFLDDKPHSVQVIMREKKGRSRRVYYKKSVRINRYVAFIENVFGRVVTGWVRDYYGLLDKSPFYLKINNTIVEEIKLEEERNDLVGTEFAGAFGFSTLVPEKYCIEEKQALSIGGLNGSEHLLQLGGTRAAHLRKHTVIGYLDGIVDGRLAGWFYDLTCPDYPIDIEIIVDGKAFVSRANGYREDVKLSGGKTAYCGIMIEVPLILFNGQVHTLAAKQPGGDVLVLINKFQLDETKLTHALNNLWSLESAQKFVMALRSAGRDLSGIKFANIQNLHAKVALSINAFSSLSMSQKIECVENISGLLANDELAVVDGLLEKIAGVLITFVDELGSTDDSGLGNVFARCLAKIAEKLKLRGNNECAFELETRCNRLVPRLCSEGLGNYFQNKGQLTVAINYYHEALSGNPSAFWSTLFVGKLTLQRLISQDKALYIADPTSAFAVFKGGIEYLIKAKAINPLQELSTQMVHGYASGYYRKMLDVASSIANSPNTSLLALYIKEAVGAYWYALDLYYRNEHRVPVVPPKKLRNVVLFADLGLPQCKRYRVDQKVQQFSLAGIDVKVFGHNQLTEAKNQLIYSDVAMVYRLPALPEVIEFVFYAKAIGKIVYYDIDDQVFDIDQFPEPFERYCGLITDSEYLELRLGALLVQEMMKLCDRFIFSTSALLDASKKFLAKPAFVHRNGIDELIRSVPGRYNRYAKDAQSGQINIFYGSGTKAHKGEFYTEFLPVLEEVLRKYKSATLSLVGYFEATSIAKEVRDQVTVLPIFENPLDYLFVLQQADINVSYLASSEFNDGKSEIKWLEAAYFGIPSIVSKTKTYLSELTHGKNVLIANSPDEWGSLLVALIENEELRIKIGGGAQETANEKYSEKALSESLVNELWTGLGCEKGNGVKKISKAISKNSLSDLPNQFNHSARKKKVLIVNVFYPPQSIGGATRVVKDNVDVLRNFYNEEFDIAVFTTDCDAKLSPYSLIQYAQDGVTVTRLTVPLVEGVDYSWADQSVYDAFSEFLSHEEPDLIHFHCVQRLTASVLDAAHNKNVPYIVTVHDAWWISDFQFLVDDLGNVCDEDQRSLNVLTKQSQDLTRTVTRQRSLLAALKNARKVLTVSECFAGIYRKNGVEISVNRNGIWPFNRLERKPSKSGKVRIAHVGGMTPAKGYNLVKEAILSREYTNLELVIVDHRNNLGSPYHETWGTVDVTFIPKISQERIDELYSSIDVLVAPSIWPESFGLVTREASHAGVWVIASNRGAIGEDIDYGRNGVVIDVTDSGDLIMEFTKIDQAPEFFMKQLPEGEVRSVAEQVGELRKCYFELLTGSVKK